MSEDFEGKVLSRLYAIEATLNERRHGCVCPPTSEQTCASPMCPRKAPPRYVPAIQPNYW